MKVIKIACFSLTLGATIFLCSTQLNFAASTNASSKLTNAADKRQSLSIHEDWQNADTVCIGSLHRNESGGAVLQVTETLKGSQKPGTAMTIPAQRQLAGIFPTDASEKQCAVFFARDPDKSLVANEIISDADKISATRCLATIFSTPEKVMLENLSALVLNPSSHCKSTFKHDARMIFKKEFLAAIAQMREKDNFKIVSDLYQKSDPLTQRELLDWMACTGDRRALPFLIEAVHSPDNGLRTTAITRLTYYFPGDTGVDECVKEAYLHGFADTKNVAFGYLHKRGLIPVSKTQPKPEASKSNYQKAEDLYARGDFKAALPLYLSEIQSVKGDHYVRRWSALKAIPYANSHEKQQILTAILPLVSNDAASGNYLEATDAAVILQKLQSDECVDSLIDLLDRRDVMFAKANRAAAFGIAKLSNGSKRKAADHLLAIIKSSKFASVPRENQMTTLLELAWIGNAQDYARAKSILSGSPAESVLNSIQPLLTDNVKAEDGHFLMDVLKNNPKLPHLAQDWIIAQLGELKVSQAADLIIAHLKSMKYQFDGFVSEDALKQIGGPYVSQKLQKIALSGEEETSKNAVDVLCEIEKEKSLPTLRKIIQTKSHATVSALSAMARLGHKEDIDLLLPVSDYWTGERIYHYWAMEAIASIRQRYGCDVKR